jgi:hypothetical protein
LRISSEYWPRIEQMTLAERADRDIPYVHKRDLTELRDKTAAALSASTANTDLKILRTAFRQAVVDRLRLDNPAGAVGERMVLGDVGARQPIESTARLLEQPRLNRLTHLHAIESTRRQVTGAQQGRSAKGCPDAFLKRSRHNKTSANNNPTGL